MAGNLAERAFLPYFSHLMDLLRIHEALNKTVTGILKQVSCAAEGAMMGGVAGGPPGALVGTIVGGVVGYSKAENYDSLVKVLQNLTDSEKAILVKKVQDLVGSSLIEALTSFITSQVKRELLVNLLRDFTQTNGGG